MHKSTAASLLATILLVVLSSTAFATSGSRTDYVDIIAAQDSVTIGANTDYVTIVGLSSLGTCGTYDTPPKVILRIRNDAQGRGQLSILLAAKLAGKRVVVGANDAYKDATGYCYLQYVKLL